MIRKLALLPARTRSLLRRQVLPQQPQVVLKTWVPLPALMNQTRVLLPE